MSSLVRVCQVNKKAVSNKISEWKKRLNTPRSWQACGVLLVHCLLLQPCFWQAASILSVHKPTWVVCDLSQNLSRIPVLTAQSDPFMCITSGPQKSNVRHYLAKPTLLQAWWPILDSGQRSCFARQGGRLTFFSPLEPDGGSAGVEVYIDGFPADEFNLSPVSDRESLACFKYSLVSSEDIFFAAMLFRLLVRWRATPCTPEP